MYAGRTRKPTMTQTTTTTATNRKPIIDNPRCRVRICIAASLSNPVADPLERERRDVVPVEPDEERPPAEMVVRHESPVAAVVAAVTVVSHHEVVPCRNLARKAAAVGIVVAVVPAREWAHLAGAHGRQHGVDGNGVALLARVVGDGLGELLHRLEPQPFEIAVSARRFL